MGEEKVIQVADRNRIPKAPEGPIKTSSAPDPVIQAVEESRKKPTPDVVESQTNNGAAAKVELVNTTTTIAEKSTTTEPAKPAPTQSAPSNSTKTATPQSAPTTASTPAPSASPSAQNQGGTKPTANSGTPNAEQGGTAGTGLFASAGKVLKDAYAWVKNAAGLKNVALGAILGTPLMMMVNSLMKDKSSDEVGDEADLEKIKSRFDSKINRTTQSLEVIASRISTEMRNQRVSDGIAGKSNITRNLIDMSLRLNESIQYLGDFINDSNLRQFKFFENVYEKLEDIEDDSSPLYDILTSFIGGFGPLIAGILLAYFNKENLGPMIRDLIKPSWELIRDDATKKVEEFINDILGSKKREEWNDSLVKTLMSSFKKLFFPGINDNETPFGYLWKNLHAKLNEEYPNLNGAIRETTDFLNNKLPGYNEAINRAINFIRSINIEPKDIKSVFDTARSVLERVDAFLKDNAPNIGSLISSVNNLVDENSGTLTKILNNIQEVTGRINKFTTPPEDGGDQSVLDHVWDHLYRFLYNRLTTLGKGIFSDPDDNRGLLEKAVDFFTGDSKPEIPSNKASGEKYNYTPPSITYDQNKNDTQSVDETVAGYSAALSLSRKLGFGTPITPNPSELPAPKEIKQNPAPELPSTPVQNSDGSNSSGSENGKSLVDSIGDLQNMDFSSAKNNTELGFNAMALLISRVYNEVQKIKIALNVKEEMK